MELKKHVEKERISALTFVTKEVLKTKEEMAFRRYCIERAVTVGNVAKVKSRITFETVDGTYDVETTVWASTDTHIVLKGGTFVPVHAIWRVEQ